MDIDLTNYEKQEIINKKTKQILTILGVKKSFKVLNQLASTIKIYKYVIQKIDHSYENGTENSSETNKDKNEQFFDDLYLGLTHNPGLPSTNTAAFKHLLMHSIAESDVVLLKSRKSGMLHMSNIVKLGKEYYYFDPTLERTIYDDDTWDENKDSLCCAALGKNDDYFKLYEPIGVLPDDLNTPLKKIPENIANESMPKNLVNELYSMVPDYSIIMENNRSKEDDDEYGER